MNMVTLVFVVTEELDAALQKLIRHIEHGHAINWQALEIQHTAL